MSVVSAELPPNTPITIADVHAACSELGVKLSERDAKDYHVLLAALHQTCEEVDALPDFVPTPDLKKFPRKDVHVPAEEENKNGAWAHKVTIEGNPPVKGLLSGKTICLKDNITVAGVPCLFGTSVFTDWIPPTDATVVIRVLEAGATVVGKAVCENFSMGASSYTSATGLVHNPYAFGFTTGGSSAGCGYLVGSEEVDLGIGGDQGGSIRLPAAFCGLVGLKATYGLVPYTGVLSLDAACDYTGPMTRTVYENALLLKVIAGTDGLDDRQMGCPDVEDVPDYPSIVLDALENGIEGLKVGILKESFELAKIEPRMTEKVKSAAKLFEELGATVEEVSIPMHLLVPTLWGSIRQGLAEQCVLANQVGRRGVYLTDLPQMISPLTQDKFDKFSPVSQNLLINNVYLRANYPHIYGKAINLFRKLATEYDAALKKYDVLILPTTPFVANTHPEPGDSKLTKLGKSAAETLNTAGFNWTGHPALNLPIGFLPALENDQIKLPVGMQIVGQRWGEGTVYRAAAAWEKAYDWKQF